MAWDLAVLRDVAAHRTGWLDEFFHLVMVVGQSRVSYLAAAVVGVLVAWRLRAWWHLVASAAAFVVAIGAAAVAKDLILRPRPPESLALVHADGFAMPSDVAAMTAAAALPIVVLGLGLGLASGAGKALAAVPVVVTLLGGVATVYLGAHWPTDVLAGWGLGIVCGGGVLALALGIRRLVNRAPAGGTPWSRIRWANLREQVSTRFRDESH